MGSLFSPPPLPKNAPLPAAPARDDAEVQEAAVEAKRRALLADRGRTIKTSPQGATGDAPVAVNTLLGGGGSSV